MTYKFIDFSFARSHDWNMVWIIVMFTYLRNIFTKSMISHHFFGLPIDSSSTDSKVSRGARGWRYLPSGKFTFFYGKWSWIVDFSIELTYLGPYRCLLLLWFIIIISTVNKHNYGKSHFEWENSLEIAMFNSHVKLPEGKACWVYSNILL